MIESRSAPKQMQFRENQVEAKKKLNIFFSKSITISELKKLGEIDTIPEEYDQMSELPCWDRNQKKLEKWISKSTSGMPSDPIRFHLELQKLKKTAKIMTPENIQLTPPPPGFGEKLENKQNSPAKKRWVDFSSDSDLSGTPIESNFHPIKIPVQKSDIILKAPPVRPGNAKREKRSKFETEKLSEKYHYGKLKFFNLKKRYGFIAREGECDVFLVEDQLIISGLNYRKFKDDVFNKIPVNFKFQIKYHADQGVEKLIAVNIEIIA